MQNRALVDRDAAERLHEREPSPKPDDQQIEHHKDDGEQRHCDRCRRRHGHYPQHVGGSWRRTRHLASMPLRTLASEWADAHRTVEDIAGNRDVLEVVRRVLPLPAGRREDAEGCL
jgi:hypothetical protein